MEAFPSTSVRLIHYISTRISTTNSKRFVPYEVKETWEDKFFCLANTDKEKKPEKEEKIHLKDKSISLCTKKF